MKVRRVAEKNILLLVVFLTGAASLVIEVAAFRILSPHFGNTIYTTSSVIGIVLGALSFGYYVGGLVSDRHPTERWFFGLILIGGGSVFLLEFFALFILPVLSQVFSIVTGPLISSLVLFFIPSFFLGTLSPFAIKLQHLSLPQEGVGRIAGEVYFWSTLGSIAGSLLAGFVFIPNFGVQEIIIGTAVSLVVLGSLGYVKAGAPKSTIFIIVSIFIVSAAVVFSAASPLNVPGLVYSKEGIYEKITIYDGNYKGYPARFLILDRSASGAMFLDSDELVYDYSKYYSVYKLFKPDIKNALVIGGGAYSLPKAILKDSPEVEVDVAEIEPSLFELGKKFFKIPDNPQLKNYVEDGRMFLRQNSKKYDLIFSDVYFSFYSIPAHFTTREFFELARERLADDGVFIANLAGSLSRETPSFILSEIRTFQSVFPSSYFFAAESPKFSSLQNIILVGSKGEKKIDFSNPKVKNSPDEILRGLSEKLVNTNQFELSLYKELTDNFTPVEYLAAKMLSRFYGTDSY